MITTENQPPIDKFRDEFFFLSNFAPSPMRITYAGVELVMPTGEHCFQGMKVAASSLDTGSSLSWLQTMAAAPTPSKSKYLGRSIRINVEKWSAISFDCMQRTQELKYGQNPDLLDKLLATGERELIEGTSWGDKIWGVNEKGEGQNLLGKILMQLRQDVRNGLLLQG